ncbi:density-regulated protein homolog [Oculina patagonica]
MYENSQVFFFFFMKGNWDKKNGEIDGFREPTREPRPQGRLPRFQNPGDDLGSPWGPPWDGWFLHLRVKCTAAVFENLEIKMADNMADEGECDLATENPAEIEEKIEYPLEVQYCGVCSLPLEYCEYTSEYEKCKEWLKTNMPDVYETLINQVAEQLADVEVSEGAAKKKQTRGGKGVVRVPKKKNVTKKVALSRAQRNKKKYVTVVTGLGTFDIDLKKAAKIFAQKYSCGSSVTGPDEIVIQGDVLDDLLDFIPEKWPEIDDESIDDLGDMKR